MSEKYSSPMLHETFRVPVRTGPDGGDIVEPGRYNNHGEPDPNGRLFLGMGSGIVHMWAVFEHALKPGQIGAATFTNTFGCYSLTGNFTAWQWGQGAYSRHAILRKQPGDPLGTSPLLAEEGEWINNVSVFEQGPDKDPTPITGSEVNSVLRSFTGDLWVSSNYTAIFHGMPFKQFGTYGFDHNTGKYHAAWVKSAQSNLSVFEGNYDPATRLLTLEGETRNCFGKTDANGVVFKVKERRVIHYIDRDTKITEVFQSEEPGKWIRRDKIYSKRKGWNTGNVPTLANTPLTLIALQRGVQQVRVVGENSTNAACHCAAGMVMLGPVWNQIFGSDLRL